jgi:hypothetical protein
MTATPAVTDAMVGTFARAFLASSNAHRPYITPPDENATATRAGLEAVAPMFALDGLRMAEQAIEATAAELRAKYRTGNVGIEYINGMEGAAESVRKAVAAIESLLGVAR